MQGCIGASRHASCSLKLWRGWLVVLSCGPHEACSRPGTTEGRRVRRRGCQSGRGNNSEFEATSVQNCAREREFTGKPLESQVRNQFS